MTVLPTQTPYYGGGQVPSPANVKLTSGAPPTTLTPDHVGTIAIDNAAKNAYILTSKAGGIDTWDIAAGSSSLDTLSGDTGTATPSAHNIKLAGTANEITTAAAGSTVTFTIPTTFIAPGSVEVTTSLTVDGVTADICDSNTASTVTIATGTGANTVNISTGNTAAGTNMVNILTGANLGGTNTLNLATGTGPKIVNVGGSGTNTSTVGSPGLTALVLGSQDTTSSTTIYSGTGGILIPGPSATANQTISIQDQNFSAGSQSITMECGTISGGSQQVAILNGTISSGTQNLSLLNGTYSGGTQNCSIMSGAVSGGSTQTLMMGVGTGPKTVQLASGTGVTTTTIGSATASSSLTLQAPVAVDVHANVNFAVAGNKITTSNIATTTTAGANSFGTVTLSSGTATVSTTAVTANSKIVLTRQTVGATGAAALGQLTIGTISAGTSFIINAWQTANATALATTDVSNVLWMIIN